MQRQNEDKSDDVPLIPVQGQQGGEANIVLVHSTLGLQICVYIIFNKLGKSKGFLPNS